MIITKIIRLGFIQLCYNIAHNHNPDDLFDVSGQSVNKFIFMLSGTGSVIHDGVETTLSEKQLLNVEDKALSKKFLIRANGNGVGVGFNKLLNVDFSVERLPEGTTTVSSDVERNVMIAVISGHATANSITIKEEKFAYVPVNKSVEINVDKYSDVFLVTKA